MKYEKMVAINKEKSRQKAEIARNGIQMMLNRKERITVTALVKYTGLSKAIFYENQDVRKALNNALLQQGECYNPKKIILDMAAKQTIEKLKAHIKLLKGKLEEVETQHLESEIRYKVLLENNIELQKETLFQAKIELLKLKSEVKKLTDENQKLMRDKEKMLQERSL